LRRAERKKETPNARGALAEEEARRIGVVVINSSSSFGDHFFRFSRSKIFIFFFFTKNHKKEKDVDAERDDAKKTPRATTPPLADPSLGRRVCAPSERGVFRSEEQSQ
jgi:hypothetical protein